MQSRANRPLRPIDSSSHGQLTGCSANQTSRLIADQRCFRASFHPAASPDSPPTSRSFPVGAEDPAETAAADAEKARFRIQPQPHASEASFTMPWVAPRNLRVPRRVLTIVVQRANLTPVRSSETFQRRSCNAWSWERRLDVTTTGRPMISPIPCGPKY